MDGEPSARRAFRCVARGDGLAVMIGRSVAGRPRDVEKRETDEDKARSGDIGRAGKQQRGIGGRDGPAGSRLLEREGETAQEREDRGLRGRAEGIRQQRSSGQRRERCKGFGMRRVLRSAMRGLRLCVAARPRCEKILRGPFNRLQQFAMMALPDSFSGGEQGDRKWQIRKMP